MANEDLSRLTIAELDELAVARGVAGYPSAGNKSEKIAWLEADWSGDPEASAVVGEEVAAEAESEAFTFRLKDDWFADDVEPSASFMAGGEAVELAAGETYETTDRQVAAGLRDLPWLEEASD